MRKLLIFFVFLFISNSLFAQKKKDLRDTLYKLESKIIKGDLEALKEIARYVDDTTFVQEFLGHHNYPNTARGVALRIIEENCLFNPVELSIDKTTTTKKLFNIINSGHLVFDDLTETFLLTHINQRTTTYQLKKITQNEISRIDSTIGKSSFPSWYYLNQIDGFLATKNPEALKWIAAAWFHVRTRFNRYYFNNGEFLDLIKKLTRLDVAVPGEKGIPVSLHNDGFYDLERLNYLIYWTNHYTDYKWNDAENYFENKKESGAGKPKEEALFELLNSENDSTAVDAYKKITELDPVKVATLSDDYQKNDVDNNSSLPTFLYRFIKQTTLFTQYCRNNNISYQPGIWQKDSLERLRQDLGFPERYRLENYLISHLSVADIASVEYFGLIYEQDWGVTFSLGRILDKFYSRNLKQVYTNKKQLAAYLKKSFLFDGLGIIGICNKYLLKFKNSPKEAILAVKDILNSTLDNDIKLEAQKAISKYSSSFPAVKPVVKPWSGNKDEPSITGLREKFGAIKNSTKVKDEYDRRSDVAQLFGKINYPQIGEALEMLLADTAIDNYYKFHFLESDFGFPVEVADTDGLKLFLVSYKSMTESQLYTFYSKKSGLDCLGKSNDLDYNKAYEILKYDIVDAFTGGGGGRRDDGVFLVIKLLELKFKTTLGYPKKQCSWQGMYSCDTDLMERAQAWMIFLEERRLITYNTGESPSISYNK